MLTADAFGILPPIARLSRDQALFYFLSGLHRQARRHRDRRPGAAADVLDVLRRAVPATAACRLRPAARREARPARRRRLARQHRLDGWAVRRGPSDADPGDAPAAARRSRGRARRGRVSRRRGLRLRVPVRVPGVEPSSSIRGRPGATLTSTMYARASSPACSARTSRDSRATQDLRSPPQGRAFDGFARSRRGADAQMTRRGLRSALLPASSPPPSAAVVLSATGGSAAAANRLATRPHRFASRACNLAAARASFFHPARARRAHGYRRLRSRVRRHVLRRRRPTRPHGPRARHGHASRRIACRRGCPARRHDARRGRPARDRPASSISASRTAQSSIACSSPVIGSSRSTIVARASRASSSARRCSRRRIRRTGRARGRLRGHDRPEPRLLQHPRSRRRHGGRPRGPRSRQDCALGHLVRHKAGACLRARLPDACRAAVARFRAADGVSRAAGSERPPRHAARAVPLLRRRRVPYSHPELRGRGRGGCECPRRQAGSRAVRLANGRCGTSAWTASTCSRSSSTRI